MEAGAGVATDVVGEAAARAAAREAMERLGAVRCSLALLFASPHHREKYPALAAEVAAVTGAERLLGCGASGVIGPGAEHERGPAVAVMAIRDPALDVRTFLVPGGTGRAAAGELGEAAGEGDMLLVFPDAAAEPPGETLRALTERVGFVPAVGGVALDDPARGRGFRFRDGEAAPRGLAGALLRGPGSRLVAVTHGCRPIGRPYVVTKADGALLQEIGSRPATDALGATLLEAFPDPAAARGRGVMLGIALDPGKHPLGHGDFVIRNLSLPDPEDTALAAGEAVAVGQTVQFHVLDAAAAREDLARQLARLKVRLANARPRFGLYFNCVSRGAALFGAAHHDVALIRETLGDFPLAGCFSHAELGPVGRANLVHQYTGVLALFT